MTTTEELDLVQAAIAGIAAIIETVTKAKSGAVDPAVALAAITALTASLAANDAQADASLAKKFDVP